MANAVEKQIEQETMYLVAIKGSKPGYITKSTLEQLLVNSLTAPEDAPRIAGGVRVPGFVMRQSYAKIKVPKGMDFDCYDGEEGELIRGDETEVMVFYSAPAILLINDNVTVIEELEVLPKGLGMTLEEGKEVARKEWCNAQMRQLKEEKTFLEKQGAADKRYNKKRMAEIIRWLEMCEKEK